MNKCFLIAVLGLVGACASNVGQSGGALDRPVGPFVVAPIAPLGCAGEYTIGSLRELCAGRDFLEYQVSDQYVLVCNTPAENRLVQFDPTTQTGVFSRARADDGYACVSSIQ